LIDISSSHQLLADALETRDIANQFKKNPLKPGTMALVVENDRDYRALGRFFAFYELSFLMNAPGSTQPSMGISNQSILDPTTGNYVTAPIPAVISELVRVCEAARSQPQYGIGGFVSNGQVETIRLTPTRKPPGLFQTMRQAISSAEPDPMVRFDRETLSVRDGCR
jgi:hypothetical protein